MYWDTERSRRSRNLRRGKVERAECAECAARRTPLRLQMSRSLFRGISLLADRMASNHNTWNRKELSFV